LFLAFHSKESALAWAAFIPLVLWTRRATRRGWCDALATLIAVAAPACAFLVLRAHMLSLLPGAVDPSVGYLENPLLHAPTTTRVLPGTLPWGLGLLLTALPLSLAVDYGPCMLPIASSAAEPWGAAAIGVGAGLLALLIAGLCAIRRHHTLFLAAACFFGFSF